MIIIISFILVLFCVAYQSLMVDKIKILLFERIEINKKRTQVNIEYLNQRINNLEQLIKGKIK